MLQETMNVWCSHTTYHGDGIKLKKFHTQYDAQMVERNILNISQSEEIHQLVYGWNFYLQLSNGQMDKE